MSILDKDFEEQIAQKIEFNTIFPLPLGCDRDRECGSSTYNIFVYEEKYVHRESYMDCDIYGFTQKESSWTPIKFTLVDRQNQLFYVNAISSDMIKGAAIDVLDRQRVIDEWGVDNALLLDMHKHYITCRLTIKYHISPISPSIKINALDTPYSVYERHPQLSDPVDIEILIFYNHNYYRDVPVKLRIV